jgi:hypothetical protein
MRNRLRMRAQSVWRLHRAKHGAAGEGIGGGGGDHRVWSTRHRAVP